MLTSNILTLALLRSQHDVQEERSRCHIGQQESEGLSHQPVSFQNLTKKTKTCKNAYGVGSTLLDRGQAESLWGLSDPVS